MEIADAQVGKPSIKYISDHPELGQSPEHGFDCSGFVRFVLDSAGMPVPDYIGQDNTVRPVRHANELWDHYGVAAHEGLQLPGDLIFFSRNGIFPTHVGIVRDEYSYIHAPGKNDTHVEIKPIDYQELPLTTFQERSLYKFNPIGFKALTLEIDCPTYRYHQKLVK